MSRIRLLSLGLIGILVAFAAAGSMAADQASRVKWHTDLKAAQKQAAATGRPMVVVFGAEWCTFCKKYESNTLNNPTMAEYLNRDFIPVHLDYDKHKETAEILEVEMLPCTLVLSAEADLLGRFTGAKEAKDVWEVLEKSKELQAKVRQVRYASRR